MTSSMITQGLGTAILLTQGFATSVHGSGGMALSGSPQAVPAAVVGRDTFTGTPGTALESHTPESGGSWVSNSTNSGNQAVLDAANRVRNGSTGAVAYTIAAAPSSADQAVQADIVFLSRNVQAYDVDVTARFSTTSLTGYSAGYNPSSQVWHISRWNGGTQTALQTVSAALIAGNVYTARLVVQGSNLSLYVNGALTIGPYADTNVITATGDIGILFRISGTTSDTDTTGAHLDNFAAQNADPSIEVFVQYTPTASGGISQGGAASQTAWFHPGASAGMALGGAKVFVADTLVTASGGMSSGGQAACTRYLSIAPCGGLSQGSSVIPASLIPLSASGGARQGGCGSCAQAVAQAANLHLTQGGAALPNPCSVFGDLITQGMATSWVISQGFNPVGLVPIAGGGIRQGGQANVSIGKQYAPVVGGGMVMGGLASWKTATVLSSGGSITQGLNTGQVITQGYATWIPVAYTAPASGGIGLGGSAAVWVAHQVVASGGALLGGSFVGVPIIYHVYMNSGQGDPINYASAVATVRGLSWTSGVLTAQGDYKLGVRAYDPLSGLEEQNVDAVVEVVLDAAGNDVTRVPPPPLGPRAVALAGGRVRVEWTSNCTDLSRQPLGFHVYLGMGSVPDYSNPVATVAWSDQRLGSFVADLGVLTDGAPYAIGVRAFNLIGEEANTIVLSIKADGNPPSAVDFLEVVGTNQVA